MEENTLQTEKLNSTDGHRSPRSLTTSIAYVAVVIVIVGIVTAAVGVVSPAFVSVIPAFALVFATGVLVLVTNNYVTATNELVTAQENMLSTQKEQVFATSQSSSAEQDQAIATRKLVLSQKEQVEAINSQVEAITDPILQVDIRVVERPTRRADVFAPMALEVFIQNVGPGEAFNIQFTEIDDFVYYLNTGGPDSSTPKPQKLSELKIMKDGVKRLAPQQKRTLARIVLDDNRGDYLGRSTHSVSITYRKLSSKDEIPDSFTLDFPYYFELVALLDYEANVAMNYVA